jgi:RNA polymerase sigma-70 factor, ECF subfamily
MAVSESLAQRKGKGGDTSRAHAGASTAPGLARALLEARPGDFERFVRVYGPKLLHLSRVLCGCREDAEEVVQETFLKVFQKIRQLREPDQFVKWLFQIAKNACLMKQRKSRFAPESELSLESLRPDRAPGPESPSEEIENGVKSERDPESEIADWSTVPEDLAIDSELGRIVRLAIDELPGMYRSVVLLRDVQGLTTAEAADILQVSPDTVKTRLHRARLALRNHLDPLRNVGPSNTMSLE